MSVDRIDSLHQKASEHYLSGEYPEAIEAWQEILGIDPGNEQALEGVRMSHLLSEGANFSLGGALEPATAARPVPAAVEQAVVADGDATIMLEREWVDAQTQGGTPAGDASPPKIGDLDPSRQGAGIDFGDVSALPPIPLGAPRPDPIETSIAALFDEDASSDGDPAQAARPEPEAVGLAAVESRPKPKPVPPPDAASGGSAAALELKNRVDDLLREAREKYDAGERDEAMGVLSRIFILDEENEEARALEAALRSESERDLGNIELWLTEGIQALEGGNLDEAESRFRMVLDRSPEHREALHYMEELIERRATAPGPAHPPEEDLLAGGAFHAGAGGMMPESPSAKGPSTFSADPSAEAVPLVQRAGAPTAPAAAKGKIPVGRAEPVAAASRPKGARRLPLPSMKALGLVAGLVVVIAGGYYGYTTFFGGSRSSGPITMTPPPSSGAARPSKPRPAPTTSAAPVAPRPAGPKTVDEALARAKSAMDSADYGAAVVAYNAALKIDGGNADARDGLARAAEGFKAQKAVQDQLDRISMAFRDGEFSAALRMLYRMPPGADPAKIERYKVNGWYNIGIVSLRAGECREAIGSFDEALAITPDEKDAKLLKEFATRYLSANRDRSFYDKVEALKFRGMSD